MHQQFFLNVVYRVNGIYMLRNRIALASAHLSFHTAHNKQMKCIERIRGHAARVYAYIYICSVRYRIRALIVFL